MKQLVLSLFPGVGLLDMAFEHEGFCVVRGPDLLWGGDIRRFHPPTGKFNGIIGGPPCQSFSTLAHLVRHNGHQPKYGNLIPEFERCVAEAGPDWFLMENVPAAPPAVVSGYRAHSIVLNNRQCREECGEMAKQSRLRKWTFGMAARHPFCALQPEVGLIENPVWERTVIGGGGGGKRDRIALQARLLERGISKPRLDFGYRSTAAFHQMKAEQGLPEDWDLPGFTVRAKCSAVANGVPLAMGRTIARAVINVITKTKGNVSWATQ